MVCSFPMIDRFMMAPLFWPLLVRLLPRRRVESVAIFAVNAEHQYLQQAMVITAWCAMMRFAVSTALAGLERTLTTFYGKYRSHWQSQPPASSVGAYGGARIRKSVLKLASDPFRPVRVNVIDLHPPLAKGRILVLQL